MSCALLAGRVVRFRSGRTACSEWNEDDAGAFGASCIRELARERNVVLAPIRLHRADELPDGSLLLFFEFENKSEALSALGGAARAPCSVLVDAHCGFSVWHAIRENAMSGRFDCIEHVRGDSTCTEIEQIRAISHFMGAIGDDVASEELVSIASRRAASVLCDDADVPVPDPLLAMFLSSRCSRVAMCAIADRIHPRAALRAAQAGNWDACAAIVWCGAPVENAMEIVMRASMGGAPQPVIAALSRGLFRPERGIDLRTLFARLTYQMESGAELRDLFTVLTLTFSAPDDMYNILSLAKSAEQLDFIIEKYGDGAMNDLAPRYMRLDHFDGHMSARAVRVFPHLVWRAMKGGALAPADIRHCHVLAQLIFLAEDELECIEKLEACDRALIVESVSMADRASNAFVALCHSSRLPRHRIGRSLINACAADMSRIDSDGLMMEAAMAADLALVGVLLSAAPHAAYDARRAIALMRSRNPDAASEMERMVARAVWSLDELA
jgi:hypothetical protein